MNEVELLNLIRMSKDPAAALAYAIEQAAILLAEQSATGSQQTLEASS